MVGAILVRFARTRVRCHIGLRKIPHVTYNGGRQLFSRSFMSPNIQTIRKHSV